MKRFGDILLRTTNISGIHQVVDIFQSKLQRWTDINKYILIVFKVNLTDWLVTCKYPAVSGDTGALLTPYSTSTPLSSCGILSRTPQFSSRYRQILVFCHLTEVSDFS